MRIAPLALLALALLLGAILRFADLNAEEMSADEGSSWAAAIQPSFATVLNAQRRLNPAELGLHDLTLHYWMLLFGTGVAAMRTLSALAGTVAIVLTFLATRELLALQNVAETGADYRDITAALAALIFAVNLLTIKYARELRMYPLMLMLAMAQAACFLRAGRTGNAIMYIGAALFTALAIAAHPMALLVFASEGVWLLYALTRSSNRLSIRSARSIYSLALTLAAGVILAGLAAMPMLGSGERAAHAGLINWIERPPPWASFALFNKGTGSVAFPVLAALAIWGVIGGWHKAKPAIIFALLWMWLPPIALMLLSYAARPVFVERYLIASFVPFFILAAIGIMELPSNALRVAGTSLALILSLGHVYAWSRKPHDTQWREGLRAALAIDRQGQPISVAPPYAVNVTHYYLQFSPLSHAQLIEADPTKAGGAVLLLGDQSKGKGAARLKEQYPRIVANLRGVEVRSR